MICERCGQREAKFCEVCLTGDRIAEKKTFKRKVWQNANKKCEMCGEDDKRCLSVHHENKEQYPFDPDRSKLLCYNCHLGKIHGIRRDD